MNYNYISTAIEYYRSRGYVYVEDVPWTVGKDAYYATRPEGTTDVQLSHDKMYLVASGEQSFIQMMLDGWPLKRAVCVTPCHRVERYNDWHRPYFMKAELINAHDVDHGHLVHMVHDACSFFESVGLAVRVLETEFGLDIVEKGTRAELGSYGIRRLDVAGRTLEWVYGTGCAEPRLSMAVARTEKSVGK